jgi:hypothetical protein
MLPFGKYGTFCDTASIPKEKVKAKRKKKNTEQAVALVGSFNAEAFLKTFSFLLLMVILLSIIFSV